MDLKQLAAVDQMRNDPAYVHRFSGIDRKEIVHRLVAVHHDVGADMMGRVLGIIGRQIRQEPVHDLDRVAVVLGDEMRRSR